MVLKVIKKLQNLCINNHTKMIIYDLAKLVQGFCRHHQKEKEIKKLLFLYI